MCDANCNPATRQPGNPAIREFCCPIMAGPLPQTSGRTSDSTVGVPPRTGGTIPIRVRIPPARPRTIPARAGLSPATAGMPPRTAGTAPARAGIAPTIAGTVPARAGMAQTFAGIIPARRISLKTPDIQRFWTAAICRRFQSADMQTQTVETESCSASSKGASGQRPAVWIPRPL